MTKASDHTSDAIEHRIVEHHDLITVFLNPEGAVVIKQYSDLEDGAADFPFVYIRPEHLSKLIGVLKTYVPKRERR